jgi:hypothetical protein
VKKTEVLVLQLREEPYQMQAEVDDTNKKVGTILVYGKPLEVVSKFKYFGSTENEFADIFDEIRIRRQCAGQAYAKLGENVYENARLKHNTKYKAFVSIVISNKFMHRKHGIHCHLR